MYKELQPPKNIYYIKIYKNRICIEKPCNNCEKENYYDRLVIIAEKRNRKKIIKSDLSRGISGSFPFDIIPNSKIYSFYINNKKQVSQIVEIKQYK